CSSWPFSTLSASAQTTRSRLTPSEWIVQNELITVAAIVIGPVLAILVSRCVDSTHETRARRMDIFRTLMRTRRTPVVPEHVGALNLIEIEFAKKEKVIGSWTKLMQHLGEVHPRQPEEAIDPHLAPEEVNRRNENYNLRLFRERQKLLAKLLHSIARELGHNAEQLEIFEGGYTPQGWHDIELEQRMIRQYVLDLYQGNRVVPVGVIDYRRFEKADEALVNDDEADN
ncbi:DUF6680 family protein, partial [Roseibaca sp. Y0-43]|uniref:DUF6680 family protein n=1 Tax=Roseibaca sp. Y0-43 TaxID=2816854 RepID=UPI001D0C2E64